MLSPEHLEHCIEVRNLCLQIHPGLMSLHPNTDVEPGLTVITNEIELEVDGIYKQMYDENTTIDEVIVMLQRYKESNDPCDQELFSCMIHFLFDEYKFFHILSGHDGLSLRFPYSSLSHRSYTPRDRHAIHFGRVALTSRHQPLQVWYPSPEPIRGSLIGARYAKLSVGYLILLRLDQI
jgi:CCR4-NOT transcription complex subunit 1 TTP binding domain